MSKLRITIKDIAKKLGISPSTVSRAIKDHPDINPDTKEKVNKLANIYGYRRNPIALNLKQNKSNTIGVVIPEIIHYFFSSVISGVGDYAYQRGYNVIIAQSNEDFQRERSDVFNFLDNRVDGILISISKNTKDFTHLRNILEQGTPVVFFDRYAEDLETDKVIVNDYEGAFNIVQHIIDQGCKRIAYMGMNNDLLIGKNRFKGYKDALEHNDLKDNEDLIMDCDNYEKAIRVTEDLLKQPSPPDGFFAINDATAIGVMEAAKNCNFNIPGDIKVAGFTNGLISKMSDPKLTTVEQNGYKMGQKAVEMIINRLTGNMDQNYTARTITLDTHVIIRESTTKDQ